MLATLVISLLPTTWIVDANNGPGTNFTDLPAAIAAAQSGDTIVVRAGGYSGFSVAGKALTIRGAGPSTTCGAVQIGAVPAGGPLVLAGMSCIASSVDAITIDSAGGQVVLLDCTAEVLVGITVASGLVVGDGSTVHAGRCSFRGGVNASSLGFVGAGTGATVQVGAILMAESCNFVGGSVSSSATLLFGGPGCLVRGLADLRDVEVLGGSATSLASAGVWAGSGVSVDAGVARIAGVSLVRGGTGSTGSGSPLHGSAVIANSGGTATVHTPVSLQTGGPGAPLTTGAVQSDPRALPRLGLVGSALPSGEIDAAQPVTVTCSSTEPGALYLFVVGFRPTWATFGALAVGDLLVDPASGGVLTGVLDPTGGFQVTLVPAGLFGPVSGLPLHLQTLVWYQASAQFLASNASTSILTL